MRSSSAPATQKGSSQGKKIKKKRKICTDFVSTATSERMAGEILKTQKRERERALPQYFNPGILVHVDGIYSPHCLFRYPSRRKREKKNVEAKEGGGGGRRRKEEGGGRAADAGEERGSFFSRVTVTKERKTEAFLSFRALGRKRGGIAKPAKA